MEWNSKLFEQKSNGSKGDNSKNEIQISARAIGFGCLALLSQSLSISTKAYITLVVADANFIPCMSGATLVNLLLDVGRFDYRRKAQRDVE